MNKVNVLALGAAVLAVISILLPWVEVSVTRNTSDLGESLQQISIHGSAIGYGLFGLLVSLIGGYLAYKEFRWTFIAGIVNFIDGYGYLHGWFGASTQDSGNYGDIASESSVDPQFGLYLFILASLAFMFFTLKNFKQKKTETALPFDPYLKENQQPILNNTATSQIYQPSKIQTMTTMTTPNSEAPKEPVQTETPQVPVQPVVTEPAPVIQQAPQVTPTPQVTFTPQPPVMEPEQKKSSTPKILLIILAIVLVGAAVFMMVNNSSNDSKDKTEQSINEEKARLDVIINEVNQDVSDYKYDDALLKINSINWLYEPGENKGYVDQYNSQRENLRNTIEQRKSSDRLDKQNQAIEEAINAPETAVPAVQPTDSVQ